MGARIDQDGAAVHDRVSVVPNAIFRRHIVIGNAFFRQHCADPDILTILIGWPALFDHITAKARTLVDAENPAYTAHHTANDPADHGTDWAGRPLTVSRAALHSARDPLGVGHEGRAIAVARTAIPRKRRIMISPELLGKVAIQVWVAV